MNLNRTSYTELAALAHCERQWWYKYVVGIRGEQSAQQARGSALHEAIAVWWDQPDVGMADINPWPVGRPDDQEAELVEWLLTRYEEHHGPSREAGVLRMIGHELSFAAPVPGTGITLRAYIDGLGLDEDGGLWVVERKSMADWRRLGLLDVDRQRILYDWLVKANGLPIKGVIYDAIRTYRWKSEKPTLAALKAEIMEERGGWVGTVKDLHAMAQDRQAAHPGVDRPAAESFVTEWLTATPRMHEEALADVRAGLQRRGALAAGAPPQRNLNQACDWCDCKSDCWEELTFGRSALDD